MVNTAYQTADLHPLYDLAVRQHGVVGRTQLIAFGMSWRAVDRRLQSGEFRRIFPGVYVFRVTPESYDQLLTAACIWGTGHASHRAAAVKHDLPGIGRARILEISTSRTLSHRDLSFTSETLCRPAISREWTAFRLLRRIAPFSTLAPLPRKRRLNSP